MAASVFIVLSFQSVLFCLLIGYLSLELGLIWLIQGEILNLMTLAKPAQVWTGPAVHTGTCNTPEQAGTLGAQSESSPSLLYFRLTLGPCRALLAGSDPTW